LTNSTAEGADFSVVNPLRDCNISPTRPAFCFADGDLVAKVLMVDSFIFARVRRRSIPAISNMVYEKFCHLFFMYFRLICWKCGDKNAVATKFAKYFTAF
jgi:hypothetical protein